MLKIENTYNNRSLEKFIKKLSPDFQSLGGCSYNAMNRKIQKVIDLKQKSPRHYQMYFDCVIGAMKTYAKSMPCHRPRLGRRSHILTDHGFCRILEFVCHVDMLAAKDMALTRLSMSSEFYPVYSPDKSSIVSVAYGSGIEP
jgi:hypothetical protein